jgi:hypothetical protein
MEESERAQDKQIVAISLQGARIEEQLSGIREMLAIIVNAERYGKGQREL